MEVIRHFDQYDDFSAEFLDKFPDSLPHQFALKLGPQEVGKAFVNWRLVIDHLTSVMLMMGKPADMSDDEYTDELDTYLKSLDGAEAGELIKPVISTMLHMLKFLPEKLNDAIVHLAVEGRQKMIIDHQKKIPSKGDVSNEIRCKAPSSAFLLFRCSWKCSDVGSWTIRQDEQLRETSWAANCRSQ